MSDLSMYELDDIIWDDFDRGDDHIVPHPANARSSRNLDASNTNFQEKEEKDSKPIHKKKKMIEKESPSHASHGVFNGSCNGDIVKDMPNFTSDDVRMTDDCFKSSYATSATGDNNSYSYPLTQISQTGDLYFVDNNCENKESGDLLYYSWPDIGNFEDVDKMLRSCDSSFGLDVTDNNNELGWFTSDQSQGTEEALKMDFKFSCPEPSGLKNMLHPDHDSPESNNHRSSCITESKDELNFKDQINMQKKQSKHYNQTEGKQAGQEVGNDDGSFYQISSDLRSNDSELSSNNRQQYRNLELGYFGNMQSEICNLPSDYLHQTAAVSMLTGIKSNQSSCDPSFEGNAAEIDDRKHSHRVQPLYVGSPRHVGMMFQSSKGVLVSDEKQDKLSVKENGQRNIERDQIGADAGFNGQESSSFSSELDEISLEATSFRQLSQVMEQLDLRTKLCIRDSLYRLARSAEQRHNNNNNPRLSSSANDLGGPLRTNNGFMDMETATNPIDRSVAHLLFHRPSESLKLPTPFPPNPNMNHGSIPPGQTEKRAGEEEEAAGESNDTIGGE